MLRAEVSQNTDIRVGKGTMSSQSNISSCHAPNLHPMHGQHSKIIDGPKQIWMTTEQKTKHAHGSLYK